MNTLKTNRATVSFNKPTYSTINRNLLPHTPFSGKLLLSRNGNTHLWFSAPILPYTTRAQVTTKMPTVPQHAYQIPNAFCQVPSVTFSNFPFLKPYSIGWLCGKSMLIQLSIKANIKGKASVKSSPLETVLPLGVHVRSVRAELFCPNPISIRF